MKISSTTLAIKKLLILGLYSKLLKKSNYIDLNQINEINNLNIQ